MQFGKSLREDIKENVELSIAQYGLIDHLPSKDPTEREQKIGLLGYYTKNPDNMDYFEDEINDTAYYRKDIGYWE